MIDEVIGVSLPHLERDRMLMGDPDGWVSKPFWTTMRDNIPIDS